MAFFSRSKTKSRRKSWTATICRWLVRTTVAWLLISAILVLPWRWIAPPTSAVMVIEQWQRQTAVNYRWVPYPQISPHLPIAVVAAEDQKFPAHFGFDIDSIVQALKESRERRRGASTLSQQVAKNLFLWQGRSYLRKGLEAYLTLLIEALWPKQRILEIYLNIAEFGPGIYGVGSASDLLFNKSPAQLTAVDSSLLAAVLPSPRRMSAKRPSDYVRQRAGQIRRSVEQLGGSGYLNGL